MAAETKVFPSSLALQEFLLHDAGGALILTPHRRLAHQVWRRQRLQASAAGKQAWEPLALTTLRDWWSQLFDRLWPEVALAPSLTRLALWRQAMLAAPPPDDATSPLSWAQALDETHALLGRHGLPLAPPFKDADELLSWRTRVMQHYQTLLRERGWLAPEELPAYLLAALEQGRLKLPGQVMVAAMASLAPVQHDWLAALSRHTRVTHLHLSGHPETVQAALAFPDPQQEMAWVTAQIVRLAHNGLPLHRLAITSPAMEGCQPQLERMLAELLGPARPHGAAAYNFSLGPSLAATPLFQAALLPLRFGAMQPSREDLAAWLLSPYYSFFQAHREEAALWDRLWRERRVDQGWPHLRRTAARRRPGGAAQDLLAALDQCLAAWPSDRAPAADWLKALKNAWQAGGWPGALALQEAAAYNRLNALLQDMEAALGSEFLSAGEFLEWLSHGAQQSPLPGIGVQDAGVQVMGLLEMRGLEFDRVFCLGMNSRALPAAPRHLPLLSAWERQAVMGGTYRSQHQFAQESFTMLLGAAPHLVLTRPERVDQEEQVATPLWPGAWEPRNFAPLSAPDAAWLRLPAMRAAFLTPTPVFAGCTDPPAPLPLPDSLSLSQLDAALACPCRFLLQVILGLNELPEILSGLDARERGQALHQVLARFKMAFRDAAGYQAGRWDHELAGELLRAAVQEVLDPLADDIHWQAERDRWLGERGLLWVWLDAEKERFDLGWRWLGMEVAFDGLSSPDWFFSLRGRIDRLDGRAAQGEVMLWDYKSGEAPRARVIFDELQNAQLPGYLLAVRRGCVALPQPEASVRAGYIVLKSARRDHVRYEDFSKQPQQWDAVLEELERRMAAMGRRLTLGDFRPEPHPAPEGKKSGACQYCPYTLVCGYTAPEAAADAEAGEGES
jgi:RecB family exonuclease